MNYSHTRAAMPINLSGIIFLFCVFSGCAEQSAALEIGQHEAGEQLYATYCTSCHEVENGIGPILKKEVIATRVTAQSLYNYNKRNMPYQAGNTLTDEEYWAITAYMLSRHGFMTKDVKLSADNAGEISLAE